MPNVKLYNQEGAEAGSIELSDAIFGVEPNEAVVHEAVVHHLASNRAGTHKTKTRSEVRGGGRKPWRQKGTGRARVGSIRSPLWRGGGITFGPQPRDYSYRLPKKKIALAMRSALSAKAQDAELVVVEAFDYEAPKTKNVTAFLKAIDAGKKTLFVVDEYDEAFCRSASNIKGVKLIAAKNLTAYDILNNDKMVMTKAAINKIEEVLA